jgi:LacI family transcriptional regulator
MRHVAILIETSRAYGRGLLRGVAQYNRERGGWSTYFQPHGLDDPAPRWLKDWKGDGILARIENRRMAETVLKAGVPTVNLRHTLPGLDLPFIGADNLAIARHAAQHLLERGFRQFAFCGIPRGKHPAMDLRCAHFQQIIEKAGARCDVFLRAARHNRPWEHEQKKLADWLRSLSKPVGVMACNDDRGLEVLDACRRAGILVPDEMAVIGVENDEHLCNLAIPPLTSIDMNAERIGYEGAALLERLMAGRRPPSRPRQVAPRGIITRRSTDVLAVEDPDIARALRFIRENACRGIRTVDVLAHVSVSRASLAPRFKRLFGEDGRTIHREIQRVQIERVKELLSTTDMPIKQISQAAGFRYVQYMTRLFRRTTGHTPARFRRRSRAGG